ncbi:unnamed protein product [Musa acuminata subsp. malaccensis]|uniref:(wild Malaysian banana) hypothetical protein n=1 Tax=Musa acuminata subsp. malaccensis TaxID=214687 RepID=A0A804IYK4_MUSAM|nr:unnamed protein product [Musa acuminata subsp. malaccensis]
MEASEETEAAMMISMRAALGLVTNNPNEGHLDDLTIMKIAKQHKAGLDSTRISKRTARKEINEGFFFIHSRFGLITPTTLLGELNLAINAIKCFSYAL